MEKAHKAHYAWVIGVVSFITIFLTIGVAVASFSAISYYLIEDWGITHAQNSFLITVRILASIVGMYLSKMYYKRFSLRMGIAMGLFMGACGYTIFALGHNMVAGIIGITLIGASTGFSGMIGVSMLVKNWFHKNCGLVLGLCSAASGFTTILLPPTIVQIAKNVSVQAAFWALTVCFAVVGLLVLLLCRNTPEEMGLQKYGAGETVKTKAKPVMEHPYAPSNLHLAFMLASAFLVGGLGYAPSTIRTLNFTTAGWTAEAAALAVSAYGFLNMVAKIAYGKVCDVVPQKKCAAFYYLTAVVGNILMSLILLPFFNFGWGIFGEVLQAIGAPVGTVGLSLFALDMCKDGDYGTWVRNYTMAYNIGALVFTPVAGISADMTGNYALAFAIFAACGIVATILTQIAYNGAAANYKRDHANA